jgi:hypothetical protein
MTKMKYAILNTSAILPLIALAPFLLQIVNAQTDNSDNGDNSGNFGERHPTFCTLGPPAASALGHPLIGILIGGICTLP